MERVPVSALRTAGELAPGFWWLYAPLQFESCAVIVILQENPDGYRTLNDVKRIGKDGRVGQLGWPRARSATGPAAGTPNPPGWSSPTRQAGR